MTKAQPFISGSGLEKFRKSRDHFERLGREQPALTSEPTVLLGEIAHPNFSHIVPGSLSSGSRSTCVADCGGGQKGDRGMARKTRFIVKLHTLNVS
jgi:hypothetical protein